MGEIPLLDDPISPLLGNPILVRLSVLLCGLMMLIDLVLLSVLINLLGPALLGCLRKTLNVAGVSH